MREVFGLGYAEAGRVLGLPRQAVYTTDLRTREKVRRIVQEAHELRDLTEIDVRPTAAHLGDRSMWRLTRGRRIAQ